MSKTFKIVILILILLTTAFILLRDKKEETVNIDESLETGGPGGERAEPGINIDTEADFSQN
jgi:hypothetical protein